jgi:hypothetical protein
MFVPNQTEGASQPEEIRQSSFNFHAPWRDYSVFDMDRFELGKEVIYIAHDRTCVFVEFGGEQIGRDVRRADEKEMSDLWERHRLIALLPVFQRMMSSRQPL